MTAPAAFQASSKAKANNQQFFDAFYPGTSQQLAFNASSGSSAQSAQLQQTTTLIRLFCTADCWVQIGNVSSSAAANTSMYLPAGIVEYVAVANRTASASEPGTPAPPYVNALGVVGAGDLYITEGN